MAPLECGAAALVHRIADELPEPVVDSARVRVSALRARAAVREEDRAMGFIISVRRSVGLVGPEDGGLGSALRNLAQIEQYGTVIERDAGSDPGLAGDPAALPWPLKAAPEADGQNL